MPGIISFLPAIPSTPYLSRIDKHTWPGKRGVQALELFEVLAVETLGIKVSCLLRVEPLRQVRHADDVLRAAEDLGV